MPGPKHGKTPAIGTRVPPNSDAMGNIHRLLASQPEIRLRLIAEFPGAAALFVRRDGENVETYESCGWHGLTTRQDHR